MPRPNFLIIPIALLGLTACGTEDRQPEPVEVTELAASEVPAPDSTVAYPIRGTGVYGIQVGDPLDDHGDRLEAGTLEDGEGNFAVYYLRGREGEELGYVLPAPADTARIGEIVVTSPAVATDSGIRVGDTFDRLRIAYPDLRVGGSEIEGRIYAFAGGYAFRLEGIYDTNTTVDPATVPDSTTISEILLSDDGGGEELEI